MRVEGAGGSGGRAWTVAAALAGCLLLAAGLPERVGAETGTGPAPSDASSVVDPGLSEQARTRIAETEAEIVRLEALAAEWAAQTAQFAQARQGAPEMLAAIEAELAKLERREPPRIEAGLAPADLETQLLGQEQDLMLARKEVAALDAEASGRAQRRKLVPERMAAAKERLRALEAEVAPAADPSLAEARQRLTRARARALEGEIATYEEELRSYDARGQLLTQRRERAALRVVAFDERVTLLREQLGLLRQGEAEIAAQEAERSLEFAEALPPPVLDALRRLAAENQELALQRTGPDGLLEKIEATRRKLARAEEQVADVTANLELLRRNVDAGGLSGSVGLLLRRARSDAPDAGMYRRFIRMRRDQIGDVQIQQIQLVERRRALDDLDAMVASKLAELQTLLTPEDRGIVEEELRSLLETQRRYLDTLIADTESYFEKLVDFDARQQELVSRSESLMRFIDERVLWTPSGLALSPTYFADSRDALAWLLAPRYWKQLLRALGESAARAPLIFALGALFLIGLPFAWPRVRVQMRKLAEQARAPDCTSMGPTAAALLPTLLRALWAPALLAFLAWRLDVSVDATQFVRCFAAGLWATAFVWATLLVPRALLRPDGIAVAHLGWAEAPSFELRRMLQWLAAVAVPAVLVITLFEARGEEAWKESIARLAFLAMMIAVLVFAHRVLRESGPLRRLEAAGTDLSVPAWAWRVAHVASLVAAFGLIVAAARGYYWTSVQLAAAWHVTLVFLFIVAFAYQLGARWLLLASRRLALRRWEQALAERAARPDAGQDPGAPVPEEPGVDLATVDVQTGRLLRNGALLAAALGVWAIWADLLPAAGALRSVELWQANATATVEMVNAAGERVSSVERRLVPVTLADLLLAFVVAAATLALARNLPGLLEISVFRQLRASAGERYAYASIGKYAVTLVGLAAAFHVVGVGWSSIQWLLAAVGIGLGFGLQEIFANFISGLIILFERPIRVGDTVTVGDISGTVSKVRIRATWITGFDRKELVVPNKEFITSRLVNWTLSDAVLRVEIPVGIAYGSDTEKAQRVLEDVANRNQKVLRDPAPYALFRGFGASSLDFELRVFSPDVSLYLKIVHELHMEIDRAFRAEGIEIAFPQRDLHVRSLPVERSGAAAERPD